VVAEARPSIVVRNASIAESAPGPGYVYLVADGLGGAPAGEMASAIAAAGALRYMGGHLFDHARVEIALRDAFLHGQNAILQDVAHHPDRSGMATTLTLACVLWPTLYLAHAGDSRCYLHRRGKLIRLTRDHNLKEILPPGVGAARRRILWNVVGDSAGPLRPDVRLIPLRTGDELLLCTDGISAALRDAAIAKLLNEGGDAPGICRRIAAAAVSAGSKDDITVVFARFPIGIEARRPRECAARTG
jgi:serine/threonine protein phosphatase PrpC